MAASIAQGSDEQTTGNRHTNPTEVTMSNLLKRISGRERKAEHVRQEGNAEFLALSRVTRQTLEKFARRIVWLERAVYVLAAGMLVFGLLLALR